MSATKSKVKRFHHITLSLFLKGVESDSDSQDGAGTEAIITALAPLDPILPPPLSAAAFFAPEVKVERDPERERTTIRRLKKEQADLTLQVAKGFDHEITIATLFCKKISHTNALFNNILAKLPAADRRRLAKQAPEHTDEDNFYIRLDLAALRDGEFRLTDAGDCVRVVCSVAAFPKKPETVAAVVQELFTGVER